MLLDRYNLIATMAGGLAAGASAGWLFFDPTAQLADIVTEAAVPVPSGLIPAVRITLRDFAVSSAIGFPKSAGVPDASIPTAGFASRVS
jgi:hypothetical protein